MPKVLGYTPGWLSRPSPGYHLFAPKQTTSNGTTPKKQEFGPRKTIATRGSEIFVAVGNEIRWADLVNLREGTEPAYRTIKASIPLPITRLTISPEQDYLAVSTSHTVHVLQLPNSSLLEAGEEDGPIKGLKTLQIGPTIHVLEESPVATTLWHPLGYHGLCLVTITKGGVVRLWELNRNDRSSFSEPALSIDLPKLANATNDQDDLSASKFGASKGFSPDSVDLEIASACFGDSPEQEGVHGWAPMTLWIATIPGDVYALCPLLPRKWQLVESPGSHTFLQTLTSSININYAELSEDDTAPTNEVRTSEKQISWLSDLEYSEPFTEQRNGDSISVYDRPDSTSQVPLLQGPFTFATEVDDFELSDMVVFSLKTLSEAEEVEEAVEGIPAAVVCLLTDTSKVHICLDLDGISGRWLPTPGDEIDHEETEHELLIAETITLVESDESSFSQSITPDVHTDFSFFVSHASGIFYISLESWIRKLENELSSPQTEGSSFRIGTMLESAASTVERHYHRDKPGDIAEQNVTSAVVIEDGNIGYLLLTTIKDEPLLISLDAPEMGVPSPEDFAESMAITRPVKQVRESWQPPKELYEPFDLYNSLNIPSRHRASLKDEIRLSPANLELLMEVHRTLSIKTSKMQYAVSELFNRATRLQEEFRDQIYRTSGLYTSISEVAGYDQADSSNGSTTANIEDRLEKVRSKFEASNTRYETLRRKMLSIGSSELSAKESNYIEELSIMESAVDPSSKSLSDDVTGDEQPAWSRVNKLRDAQKEAVRQLEEVTKRAKQQAESRPRGSNVLVPGGARKAETAVVNEELERNSMLVEAVTEKLRSLGVSMPVVTT